MGSLRNKGFASDNNASVWPEVLEALGRVNIGHAKAYGGDPITDQALEAFRREFGPQSQTFFVFNGTGANVLSIKASLKPFEGVICAHTSHLHVDECGAPESLAGIKVRVTETSDGKLTPKHIEPLLIRKGDIHFSQPRMVSISQPTELGTVYSSTELQALSEFCRAQGLLLHVDGARLPAAAVSLGVGLAQACKGADVLSFGGTKSGLLHAEAVVFLNPTLGSDFGYLRKQNLQLGSKMRYTAVQFLEFLDGGLWKKGAENSVRLAHELEARVRDIEGVEITQKVEANAVFARLPHSVIQRLREQYFFYVWDEKTWEVRWMTAFDTTDEDVSEFADLVRSEMANWHRQG